MNSYDSTKKAIYFKNTKKMTEAGKKGFCLMPIGNKMFCGKPSAASHSIQKNGGLLAIAEGGKVIRTAFNAVELFKTNGSPEPCLIGIGEASTFPGFCSGHDNELFKPIEQTFLEMNNHNAFLFYYRTWCLEIVRKQKVVDTQHLYGELAPKPGDFGFDQVSFLLNGMKKVTRQAIKHMIFRKKRLDKMLLSKDYSDIRYCHTVFDGVLPVVSAFGFYPLNDWQGGELQDLGKTPDPMAAMSFTVTSYEGKTHLVFAWLDDSKGVNKAFIDSYLGISDEHKASRVVPACIELAENTFVRPSWWGSLSDSDRNYMKSLVFRGLPGRGYQTPPLAYSVSIDPNILVNKISCTHL